MDPRTGELYRLHPPVEASIGDAIAAKEAKAADLDTEAKLEALLAEKDGGDRPLILVDEAAAQRIRLGDRELRRRKQRRR